MGHGGTPRKDGAEEREKHWRVEGHAEDCAKNDDTVFSNTVSILCGKEKRVQSGAAPNVSWGEASSGADLGCSSE